MRNGRRWQGLLTVVLLSALTGCFSCATRSVVSTPDIKVTLARIAPALPTPPVSEPVRFEERDGGLWLTYEAYRALEWNVIGLREYAARLAAVGRFYEPLDLQQPLWG
jgi:hypothetical protein